MRYMLDTNILISVIRQPQHPVATLLAAHVGRDLCVSSVTWAELVYGAERSASPAHNLAVAQQLLAGIPVLPFDTAAATGAGRVMAFLAKAGTPIGDRDALIAGHALSLNLTVITHNIREFARVPELKTEDWLVNCSI